MVIYMDVSDWEMILKTNYMMVPNKHHIRLLEMLSPIFKQQGMIEDTIERYASDDTELFQMFVKMIEATSSFEDYLENKIEELGDGSDARQLAWDLQQAGKW
jgi:hypothetical protein